MQRKHILFWFILLSWLLTACGADSSVSAGSLAAGGAVAVEGGAGEVDLFRPYADADLSLVGNTGRPQFLNSHAVW